MNKVEIQTKLAEYVAKYESQNKAANSLKGVSAATISQMLNNNWSSISDEMWKKVAKQIGLHRNQLEIVSTKNFVFLNKIFKDAALNSIVYAVVGEPGSSKTIAATHFCAQNKNAFRITCNHYVNMKIFLSEMLRQMGRDPSGMTINDMVMDIVKTAKTLDFPVFVFDEIDKMNDQILYFFITMYNYLYNICGFVFLSTDYFEKRMRQGLTTNKKGYKEVYSRIGRRFVELPGVSPQEVMMVCSANGITEKSDIKDIVENCDNDLRRVERMIHVTRLKEGKV